MTLEKNNQLLVDHKTSYIVGIGASAGGLETLTALVSKLPQNLNCSIVIIQHLSPNYRSMMVDLLARETSLHVEEAENGSQPRPGIIYIAPPKWDLILKESRLVLAEPIGSISPKPSVNRFFSSLAEEKGEYAISVVLSGTGTDGAVGSRAIKASGGITFAQLPETAKYTGMPMSAINTGLIDRVLPPEDIAEEITRLVHMDPSTVVAHSDETESEQLKRLFRLIRKQTKIDFSGYKKTTVWRRIQRRMTTSRLLTFDDYLQYVQENPKEIEALSKDILISVTAFYRDPEVFLLLQGELIKYLESKVPGDEIRVWVPGCATGEEAYTIAILLHQILGSNFTHYHIQIFATDIDMDALDIARKGVYPSTLLETIEQSLVDSYFMKQGSDYVVNKELRDVIVFARQDIVLDPPFLRLDLISCRNLLIYFDNSLQSKVLQVFNYALLDEGLMLLGRSESVSQHEAAFASLNSRGKLFKSIAQHDYIVHESEVSLPSPNRKTRREQRPVPPKENFDSIFSALVDEHYIPPSVLVDTAHKLIKIHGDVSPYIHFGMAKTELEITELLNPDISAEVMSLLHNVKKRVKTVKGRRRRVKATDQSLMQVVIHPWKDEHTEQLFYLISFLSLPRQRRSKTDTGGLSQKALEDELVTTREHLQSVSEELETSNEELQALNEEVQASNEELQASNEELEASNEELQATNEELVTVNEEVMAKSAELAAINADFVSVHNSLDYPVVVLDGHLNVTRINNTCRDYLTRLLPSIGDAIETIKFDDSELSVERIKQVQKSGERQTLQVKMNAREYQLHLTPCGDLLGQERGVVMSLIDQHELILSEREASKNRRFLMSVMDNAVSLISVKDLSGRYQFANQAFGDFFSLNDVTGKTDSMLFDDAFAMMTRQHDLAVMESLKPFITEERFQWQGLDRLFESVRFPLFDDEGVAYAICCQSRDLTLEKGDRDQLRLNSMVFDRAAEGIMVTNKNAEIVSVNASFSRVTGYSLEDVKGKKPSILSSGKHHQAFYQDMWAHIKEHGWWQGEIWNKRKNNEVYPELLSISEVKNERGELINFLGIFSDISIIKESQLHAEFLATHDDLTGLPNRTLFNDRVQYAINRASRSEQSIFLLFCDLDNFKIINDTLGHKLGDKLLSEVANRMLKSTRSEDTVARIGGDEFVLMLEEADIKLVEQIAHRVLMSLSDVFHLENNDLYVTTSIGISKYPEDGDDVETLMKNADSAMYRSKEMGKNQYTYFAEEMRYESQRRLAVEMGLRLSLEKDEFELVYQPIVNCKSGEITHCEALLRWRSNDFLNIGPADFIPIAEQSGLIKQLDSWVIGNVLASLNECKEQKLVMPRVSINLSGHSLNSPDIAEGFSKLLERYGIDGQFITIEVTENVLIQSLKLSSEGLAKLRNLGIHIAIDDFGTGYSSLQYLQQLPIDILKIDRSFVDGIDDENGDFAITKAIISLAHALGLETVAEGIETEPQMQKLKQLGCDYGQGYFFHRPMPKAQLLNITQATK